MKLITPLCLMLCAAPAGAHPHIFVDTGIEVIVDVQNRLTHLRITWQYDEFYSLLIGEDLGIDADYDGVLTDAERDVLTGFDMNWIEGYNGDLVARLGGETLALSGPLEPTATLTDGKITTTHLRRVETAPELTAMLSLKPYDPTYYTAYEVGQPLTVTGRDGCEIVRDAPDPVAVAAITQSELAAIPEDPDQADAQGYGDIGVRFATEIRIRCASF